MKYIFSLYLILLWFCQTSVYAWWPKKYRPEADSFPLNDVSYMDFGNFYSGKNLYTIPLVNKLYPGASLWDVGPGVLRINGMSSGTVNWYSNNLGIPFDTSFISNQVDIYPQYATLAVEVEKENANPLSTKPGFCKAAICGLLSKQQGGTKDIYHLTAERVAIGSETYTENFSCDYLGGDALIPTPAGFFSEYTDNSGWAPGWKCKLCPEGYYRDETYAYVPYGTNEFGNMGLYSAAPFLKLTSGNCYNQSGFMHIIDAGLCKYAAKQLIGSTYSWSTTPMTNDFKGCMYDVSSNEVTLYTIHYSFISENYKLEPSVECSVEKPCICVRGEYYYNMDSKDCKECPLGYYTNGHGTTECSFDCYATRPRKETGACKYCAAGTYRFYDNNEEKWNCGHCPGGYYKAVPDAGSCKPCVAGRFQNRVGDITCIACPGGWFQNGASSTTCKNCAAGKYQNQISETACVDCTPGKITNTDKTACIACDPGKITNTDQTACIACDPGKITNTDKTVCVDCAPGQYTSNNPGQISCTECNTATYGTNADRTNCEKCQPGTYSRTFDTGNVCTSCPAGYFQQYYGETNCAPCATGKSQEQTRQSECNDCVVGRYQNATGSSTCVSCNSGKYQNLTAQTTQTSCQLCPPGQSQNQSGQSGCKLCASHLYADQQGLLECKGCQKFYSILDKTTLGKSNADNCEQCQIGKYWTNDYKCHECQRGKYNDQLERESCFDCALGKYNNQTGQTSETACQVCEAGTYSDQTSSATCTKCPAGKYSDAGTGQTSSTVCKSCSAGTYNDVEGQTSESDCKKCPTGKYSDAGTGQANSDVCKSCSAGTYNDVEGQTSESDCKKCSKGKYNNLIAQTSESACQDCEAGTYSDQTSSATCKKCPKGKYSDAGTGQTNSTVCKSCSAGTYNDVEGQTSESDCKKCPTGKYSDTGTGQTNSDVCKSCSAGKYNDAEGQTSESDCQDCGAGKYNNIVSQYECTDCGVGKYNSDIGSTLESACKLCGVGKFNNQTGKPSESDCQNCPIGRYNSLQGQELCTVCSKGQYQPQQGQTECNLCGTGKFNDQTGETLESDCQYCPVGRYNSLQGQELCTLCSSGRYQTRQGQTACSLCSPGKSNNNTGSNSSDACVDCTFGWSKSGAAECTGCPGRNCCNDDSKVFNKELKTCEVCGEYLWSVRKEQTTDNITIPKNADENFSFHFDTSKGHSADPLTGLCETCQAGQYMTKNWLDDKEENGGTATAYYKCQDCPNGRYGDTEPTTEELFTRNLVSTVYCKFCPKNEISEDNQNCQQCASGKYRNSNYDGWCTYCPSGWTPSNGAQTCQYCPQGKTSYKEWDSTIQSYNHETPGICVNCDLGKTSTHETFGICENCPAGQYATSPGVCSPCSTSMYQDDTGQHKCKNCPWGRFADVTGLEVCKGCPTGTANTTAESSDSEDDCIDCTAGKYQDQTGTTICKSCPQGRYENDPKSSECKGCSAGFHGTDDVTNRIDESQSCTACVAGKYGLTLGAETSENCTACVAGKYEDEAGQTRRCKPCSSGKFADVIGLKVCKDCPKGKYMSGQSATECETCTHGKYQNEKGQTSCKSCPVGTKLIGEGGTSHNRVSNAISETNCTACPLGQYGKDAATTATNSDDWYHRVCLNCYAGFFQNETGKADLVSCKHCGLGKFSGTGEQNCDECDAGKFADVQGLSVCKKCPHGKWQNQQSQSACKFCAAGKQQSSDVWSSEEYTSECTQNCSTGTHKSSAMLLCESCSEGKYNDLSGQTECKFCPGHTKNTETRSTSINACEDCPSGRRGLVMLNSQDGSTLKKRVSTCGICNHGKIAVEHDCQHCPDGKYNPIPGQLECFNCPAGYYQKQSLKPNTTPDIMTTWEASVTNAQETGVLVHGESPTPENGGECFACPAGFYSATEGSSECSPCAPKHYSTDGQYACTMAICPPSLPSAKVSEFGSKTVTEACQGISCPQGTFVDGSDCQACAPGKYQSRYHQPQCEICQAGQEPNSEATGCQNCQKGYFSVDQQGCIKAPVGTFVDTTGASTTKNCTSGGTKEGATSDSDCGECEVGWSFISGQPCRQDTCPIHTQRNTEGKCEPCPSGMEKKSQLREFCTLCKFGTFSISGSACMQCEDGDGVSADGICSECPVGTFSFRSKCVSCPGNLWTSGPGLTRCDKYLGTLDTCTRDAHNAITESSESNTVDINTVDIISTTNINICVV